MDRRRLRPALGVRALQSHERRYRATESHRVRSVPLITQAADALKELRRREHFTVTDPDAPLQTEIDAAELEAEQRDEEWRAFCLEAEQYALANTRRQPPARRAAGV